MIFKVDTLAFNTDDIIFINVETYLSRPFTHIVLKGREKEVVLEGDYMDKIIGSCNRTHASLRLSVALEELEKLTRCQCEENAKHDPTCPAPWANYIISKVNSYRI